MRFFMRDGITGLNIKFALALLTQLLCALHFFFLFREAITASFMRKDYVKLLVTHSFYVAKHILRVVQFCQLVQKNLKHEH